MFIKDTFCFISLQIKVPEVIFLALISAHYEMGPIRVNPHFAHIISEKYIFNCLITINVVIKLQN